MFLYKTVGYEKLSSMIEGLFISAYAPTSLEEYFAPFRENVIGRDCIFKSPFGEQKIIYADWAASGRIYKGIEEKLIHESLNYIKNYLCDHRAILKSILVSPRDKDTIDTLYKERLGAEIIAVSGATASYH